MNRTKIEDALLAMGVPAGIKGFNCIADAVMLLDTEEWKNEKMEALYYKIGKMNNTTSSKVERAIRFAFETARKKGEHETVNHYIGFTNCENSNSLKQLHMMLKREES